MRKRSYETTEYAAMMRRTIGKWIIRVGDGDPSDLAELLAASRQLDLGIREAVTRQRAEYGTTWETIGKAAGTTRQAAQQRWAQPARRNAVEQ